MKTHFERVNMLHFEARLKHHEKQKRELMNHTISLVVVFSLLVLGVAFVANLPEFFVWIDSIHPVQQFVIVMTPIAIFGLWRLKKMIYG